MRRFIQILCFSMLFFHFGGTSLVASESYYTVQSGDSLWKIATKYGVTVNSLKNINNLNSDFLKIGDKLLIHTNEQALAPAVETPSSSDSSTVYSVQSGDSLWTIAQKHAMSVERLKQLNNLNSDELVVGQQLKVENNSQPTPSRSGTSLDGSRIIEKGAEFLGTPYRYGGQRPGGFDCSGFVLYIYSQFGYDLPHNAAAQYRYGADIGKSDLAVGDLVFFACNRSGIDHVGIYSGNNQFIHSSSPRSGGVIYSSLSEGYYAGRYVGARRILR